MPRPRWTVVARSSPVSDRPSFTGEIETRPYRHLHPLSAHQFHATHDVLFHLHELRQLLGEIRAEGTGGLPAEGMPYARHLGQLICVGMV